MAAPIVGIDTERLHLRRWRFFDRAPFAALNADPEVMRHFPSTLDEQESNAFAYRNAALLEVHGYGLWAVEVLATGEFVGFVGLNHPTWEAPFTPCTEVGWRLARSAWGQGYATEGARAALAFGLDSLLMDEILSWTVPANSRSRRVMEKLGMRHARTTPCEGASFPGTEHGDVWYELTRAEWNGAASILPT